MIVLPIKRLDYLKKSELILDTLAEKAARIQNWVVFYSGGKDSSTLAAVIGRWSYGRAHSHIRVHVVYVDTRIEPPPMNTQALKFLKSLRDTYGVTTHHLTPNIEESFWVNLLGRGYPPSSRKFRWCTERLKLRPALRLLQTLENPVSFVGSRLDESAHRSRRLKNTCSVTTGECGTKALTIRLSAGEMPYVAPLLHWKVENVWQFLAQAHIEDGLAVSALFDIYAGQDLRYGCWTCSLVRRDRSGEALLEQGHIVMADLLAYRTWLLSQAALPENRFLRPNGVKGRLSLAFRRKALAKLRVLESRIGMNWLSINEYNKILELWDDPRYGEYR